VADYGVTAASLGIRTWAVTQALAANEVYWLVLVAQGGSGGTAQVRSAQGLHHYLGDVAATPNMNATFNTYYSTSTVSGALPSTFGTLGGIVAGPRFAVKFAL
jgi:hypothetical protein